jgi:acetyltransferase-like isoleucine patch superfamily enzyme
MIDSKRRKLGIITGKKVKTGINSSLMPGIKLHDKSIVGAHVLLQDDLSEQTIYAYNKKNELIKKKHRFF